jgi:hypothetical protein
LVFSNHWKIHEEYNILMGLHWKKKCAGRIKWVFNGLISNCWIGCWSCIQPFGGWIKSNYGKWYMSLISLGYILNSNFVKIISSIKAKILILNAFDLKFIYRSYESTK